MLTAYPSGVAAPTWLDLVNPTDAERASIETRYGLQLPTRAELSEIESSSRIFEETGILCAPDAPCCDYFPGLHAAPPPQPRVCWRSNCRTCRAYLRREQGDCLPIHGS
jgi:hypothetical protein